MPGFVAGKYGFLERSQFNLLRNSDADISLPCICENGVFDWESDIGFVVCLVLPEDSVSPGGVEISACHYELF